MKRFTYLLPVLLLVLSSCTSSDGAPELTSDAMHSVSEEQQAIDQAVLDVYKSISFTENAAPDFDYIASLFTPTATMYNFRYDSLAAFDITVFIESFEAAVDRGAMTSFSEVELGGKTEYFGHVAHRMSSYASYFNGSDEIGERGVNSFQLLKIDGKWIVNSVIWDVEKEGQPIPERYLD